MQTAFAPSLLRIFAMQFHLFLAFFNWSSMHFESQSSSDRILPRYLKFFTLSILTPFIFISFVSASACESCLSLFVLQILAFVHVSDCWCLFMSFALMPHRIHFSNLPSCSIIMSAFGCRRLKWRYKPNLSFPPPIQFATGHLLYAPF